MNWQDKGYLLSKNKYNENSVISEFYTENHGKISAIKEFSLYLFFESKNPVSSQFIFINYHLSIA